MRTIKNLLAGFSNAAWSAILGLAVLPIYLKYLGIESYGLIGFSVMMQSVMSLLDMGITPTINREIARFAAKGKLQEAGKLLHTLAVIYWCIGAIIAVSILLLAPFISEYWLESKKLPKETILYAVMLMGLIAGCRFPISIYQGVIIGAQRITVSSAISITITTISYVGAIAILEYVSKTIYAFFIWQACIGIVYAFSMRRAAWKIIGRTKKIRFDVNEIRLIWRFSLAMSGVAVSSVILVQIDKLLLSKFLSLEDFGCYVLAGTITGGLSLLIGPTFQVIYPRLSALVIEKKTEVLLQFYQNGTRIFCSVLFPATITAILFSIDFLYMWTGNMDLALKVKPILSLLLIGTTLNGVMIFPYAIQLASGLVKLSLMITCVLIIIYTPLVIYLTLTQGVIGGSLAWALLNFINFIFGTWATHQKILKGMIVSWVIFDIILPLVISVVVIIIGWKAIYIEGSHGINLISGSLLIFFTIVINLRLLAWDSVGLVWARKT